MEEKERNVVVKISMPKSYADCFLTETEERFGDSRFVHLLFKDKIYEAMRTQQQPEIQEQIELARICIIEQMNKYYNAIRNERRN